MKIIYETLTTKVERYVSVDGVRFDDKESCIKHECDLEEEFLKDAVAKIERCTNADGYAPMDGCEYTDTNAYRWYRPKNRQEADILERFYNLEYGIDDNEIGGWICIERSFDCYDTWEHNIETSIAYIKRLLGFLGYEVTITKKED